MTEAEEAAGRVYSQLNNLRGEMGLIAANMKDEEEKRKVMELHDFVARVAAEAWYMLCTIEDKAPIKGRI